MSISDYLWFTFLASLMYYALKDSGKQSSSRTFDTYLDLADEGRV